MNKIPLSDRSESRSRMKSDIEALSERDIIYNKNTSEIYQDKLISQFEDILVEAGLQSNQDLRIEDLKRILSEMNLISLTSNCKKWEILLNEMWKLLTSKKSSVDYISVRSAKIFILGVWGIESQMIYETSEADSTPSASTGESRACEEFIFASSEHLNSIRSKFNEMVLHKLTYVNELKSSKWIKKCKNENSIRLSKYCTKQSDKRNVS